MAYYLVVPRSDQIFSSPIKPLSFIIASSLFLYPLSSPSHPLKPCSLTLTLTLAIEMASATAPLMKTLSLVDSSLFSLTSLFTTKTSSNPFLSVPSKPIKLQVSCFSSSSPFSPLLSLKKRTHSSSVVSFVAQTSGWAQQEEDNSTATLEQEEQSTWENQDVGESGRSASDWDAEDGAVEAGESEAESGEGFGVFNDGGGEEEEVYQPSEDAKIFIGNLPYDVDSNKLAMLFEKAGIVEIAEVKF